jgi:hypothetical protein
MTVLTEAAKKIKISPELSYLYGLRNLVVVEHEHHKVGMQHHKLGITSMEELLSVINKRIAEQEAKDNG